MGKSQVVLTLGPGHTVEEERCCILFIHKFGFMSDFGSQWVKNYKIILQFIDSNYFYVSCRLSIRMFKLNFCINEINSLPRH